MSKIITSPVKRYPGSVTLSDPLIVPQCLEFERALGRTDDYFDTIEKDDKRYYQLKPGMFFGMADADKIPAIVACVEKWELANFPQDVTVDTFPMSPRAASHELIDWLWSEIAVVYIGETEIPNK